MQGFTCRHFHLKIALQKPQPIIPSSLYSARLLITSILSLLRLLKVAFMLSAEEKKMLIGPISERAFYVDYGGTIISSQLHWSRDSGFDPDRCCAVVFLSLQSFSRSCETRGLKMDECSTAPRCSVNIT